MRDEDADQARFMSLVPQKRTPFALLPAPPRKLEALCIAVARLAMPEKLIPASLDVDGIKGLRLRMEAGANVVTSIIPPEKGLAGVSQSTLDIDKGLRSVPEVKRVLAEMGLRAATADGYLAWVADRKPAAKEMEDIRREGGHHRGAASGR
jgi:methylornithine synthase